MILKQFVESNPSKEQSPFEISIELKQNEGVHFFEQTLVFDCINESGGVNPRNFRYSIS
jgi:hypothetical protein